MEKSTDKKPETTADKKEPVKGASLSGTEEKKSPWEIGLETVAGDNKLLGTLLKIALSPVGLVVLICGAGYLLYKNANYKSENQKLVAENKLLLEEIKDLKKDHEKLQEKYLVSKSRKIVDYEDQLDGFGDNPNHRSHLGRDLPKKQRSFYLD